MIFKYDQTEYKIRTDNLEDAIKDIKAGNKYINKLENEIIYYKIKINKAIDQYENRNKYKKERFMKDVDVATMMYEILKGSDK